MKKKTIQWVQVVFLIGCLVLGGLSAPSWGAEGVLLDAADLARVKSLIAAKADVNANDEYGLTALILASMGGHVDVVRALLAAKADVNAQINDGKTAPIFASGLGHVDVVRALLAAKADVNTKSNHGGTALMAASMSGNAKVVKLLRQAGATE